MSVNFEREKLLEAMAFFYAHVRRLGWIKLFKLVYYLDLIHFRRTGRTVTGLKYQAWKKGPVPPTLWNELKAVDGAIRRDFEIVDAKSDEIYDVPTIDSDEDDLPSSMQTRWAPGEIRPRKPFQHHYLSRRELGIATELAEMFRDATAEQMSEASHNHRGPWMLAWNSDDKTIDLLKGRLDLGKADSYLPIEELLEIITEQRANPFA